jgi:molybdopterin molybdotransferase
MATYVLFARPALAALQGAAPARRRRAPLGHPHRPNAQRVEAVRVRYDEQGRVHVTGAQGSHVFSSLLGADALALIPPGAEELPAGTPVLLELL